MRVWRFLRTFVWITVLAGGTPAVKLKAAELKEMLRRLGEEAEAFQKIAPQVTAEETLQQSAMVRPRFRPRIGNAAKSAPEARRQERTIVSQYAYSNLDGRPQVLYEVRQVISVDNKKVNSSAEAQKFLAAAVQASDSKRLELSLKQFEKYGLRGAVTDFGQLLMLFTAANQQHFEFRQDGSHTFDGDSVLVIAYRQIDGPEKITILDDSGAPRKLDLQGEIWVHESNLVPARVTVKTASKVDPAEPAAKQGSPDPAMRIEATVEYERSDLGALMPKRIEHTEYQFGRVTAENRFTYAPFRRF